MSLNLTGDYSLYTPKVKLVSSGSVARLQLLLIRSSFFNLLLVALAGVLLRTYPFTDAIPFTYKNLLHGHSHFAFGGWVMPVITALILKLFPDVIIKVGYQHWRNITVMLLVSAYGMLLSFPVQGYGAVSIFFSTLSVATSYYLAFVLWKALKSGNGATSHLFLKCGLFFLVVSAIGPFATGPLIATGKTGTHLYYNAIYFYLHFQYNGWFTFAVLAILYKQLEAFKIATHGKRVLKLFLWACIPSFALSVLWNGPSIVYNFIGGVGALLQIIALLYLWKDVKYCKPSQPWVQPLLIAAFAFFILKNVLQLFSALPVVAEMAYLNRNFIIAYLHLVLLGCISVFVFATVFQHFNIRQSNSIRIGLALFFFSFISTELLLVGNAMGNLLLFSISHYPLLILCCSMPFPVGIGLIFYDMNKQMQVLHLVS